MKKTLIAITAGLALTACAADVKTDTPADKAHAEQAHGEKTHEHKGEGHKAHGEKSYGKKAEGEKGQKGKKRDLSGAATTLGVSEADLRQAMRLSLIHI